MLVTFKSRATGPVQMFAEHARQVLEALGKPFEPAAAPRGIISADEIPLALERLRAAVNAARSAESGAAGEPLRIGFAQRAYPLIDMLERAQRRNREVVWGV